MKKKVKTYKELNETSLYFNETEYDDIDNRYEVFNLSNDSFKYEIDMSYYCEIGLGLVLDECLKYEIYPNKNMITYVIKIIMDYSHENFLYKDSDNINEESELGIIVGDFLGELKNQQPDEYKKYEIIKNTKDFNI